MIDFEYTVLEVYPDHLFVEYSAEGYSTVCVGVRLPESGENLDDVMVEFAPNELWRKQKTTFKPPVAGVKGKVVFPKPPTAEEIEAERLAEIAAAEPLAYEENAQREKEAADLAAANAENEALRVIQYEEYEAAQKAMIERLIQEALNARASA